jgi:hypothetical protein
MSWFVIEIGVALAPFGVLLWWTVRALRRRRLPRDEAQASAGASEAASASEGDRA